MPFKLCKIIWEKKIRNKDNDESEIFTITTPVPTGMVGLMGKLQEAAGRSYQSLPVSVREHFNLSKENFNSKSKDFTIETIFENNEQHGFFYHLFCRFCEKSSLKTIWEKYPDKLPEERSAQNLMLDIFPFMDEHWHTWMHIAKYWDPYSSDKC